MLILSTKKKVEENIFNAIYVSCNIGEEINKY